MGLPVDIFKFQGRSYSNGGASSKFDTLTLVNVPGPFEPREDSPAALLLPNYGGTVRVVLAMPQDGNWVELKQPNAAGPMFGGTYVATSDSRFSEAIEAILGHGFYGAVKLHDRYESAELANHLSR